MAPDDLADFTSLAARVGIAVPDLLRAWIETGRTSLPEILDTTFSEFLADRPLALVGHPDLEWLSLAEATETVDEWPFAEAQNGVAFLPSRDPELATCSPLFARQVAERAAAWCGTTRRRASSRPPTSRPGRRSPSPRL